jgi:Ca2+-binding EF-hand superfamily protein
MYDVDGNGVIDLQEMTKIVQVRTLELGLADSHLGYQLFGSNHNSLHCSRSGLLQPNE